MTFDPDRYLARINRDPKPATLAGLADLQRAQMQAIPFENCDPFLGNVPDLDPEALWRKLVLSRRGGYCLELNALFGSALAAFGYRSRAILGRVRMGAMVGGPRSHLAHVVLLDGEEYLADTGFGGPGPDVPLALGTPEPVETPLGTFRLRPDAATGEHVLERRSETGWFGLYGFDGTPFMPIDIIAANVVCTRWEASPFPAHLMLNRIDAGGRVSLFDLRLTRSGTELFIGSREEFREVLDGLFHIELDVAPTDAIWTRLQ